MKFIPKSGATREQCFSEIHKTIIEVSLDSFLSKEGKADPKKIESFSKILSSIAEFCFDRGIEFGESNILNKFMDVSTNVGDDAKLKDVIELIIPANKKN